MRDGQGHKEETLLGKPRVHEPALLGDYLRDFYKETPKLIRPFIEGDGDSRYNTIPDDIQDLRAELMAEESDRGYLSGEHAEDSSEDTAEQHPPFALKRASQDASLESSPNSEPTSE